MSVSDLKKVVINIKAARLDDLCEYEFYKNRYQV